MDLLTRSVKFHHRLAMDEKRPEPLLRRQAPRASQRGQPGCFGNLRFHIRNGIKSRLIAHVDLGSLREACNRLILQGGRRPFAVGRDTPPGARYISPCPWNTQSQAGKPKNWIGTPCTPTRRHACSITSGFAWAARRTSRTWRPAHLKERGARERELIALKYGAGINNRLIAQLTGLSESNVGTILHRVVQTLRSRW